MQQLIGPRGQSAAWLGAMAVCLALPLHAQAPGGHAGEANAHMHRHSVEQLTARFESPERNAWQKPDEVVALMGDLRDKVVMDIGSGSGYFSFRLLQAGARVICADVDQRLLDHIGQRAAQQTVGADRMELRRVPYDSANLRPNEVDAVLIVNTYHHIADRTAYFTQVHTGLKPTGQLVVVDFFKRDDTPGPPVSMKLAAHTVVSELVRAGFSRFEINRELLPYQYVIRAFP